MGGCLIDRTTDVRMIKRICLDPVVWETISEDGMEPDDFVIDVEGECWLSAQCQGQVIGVFNLHGVNGVTVQIHPMVLPEFRGILGYNAGRKVIEWVFENTHYERIQCFVPEIYRNVILYALSCGMAKEAKMRRSFLKNGIIHDMTLLAITRSDVEGV
jgi:RimJ/RimL family protein N-acetyltransferase